MYEYPFGNGQQLNLDWFLNEWKNLLAAWEAEKNGIEGALQAEIDRAEAALADVFAARDAAAQSATAAGNSADAAAQSATDASGYLTTVHADANAAQDAARNAAQSESNAGESAQTALSSKNAAGQSERNAAQSEANANSSKNAAAQSAADALANKDAAAQSAADALANKDAAAQSAEDAENAATSVEGSAQQIATNTSDIANLKNNINPYTDNNAFDYTIRRTDNLLNWLSLATENIQLVDGELQGSLFNFNAIYGGNNNYFFKPEGFSENQQFTVISTARFISGDTSGGGLRIQVIYTDGTSETINSYNNDQIGYETRIAKTNATKTVNYFAFSFGSNGRNIWAIKDISIVAGNATEYLGYYTAVDYVARAEIAKLQATLLENMGG